MDFPTNQGQPKTSATSAKDTAGGPERRISHDLANLLGVILGNADLALMDLEDDHPAADCLREIQNSAREARQICREMRDGLADPILAASNAGPTVHGLRFLLIDDEDAFRSLAARALRKLGHEVSVFSSAATAHQAFDANPTGFDIVITDLNMPETSGLEVATRFLERAPDLCICLASGDVDDALRERARIIGARDVFRKPNTIAEFAEVIQSLVEAKESRGTTPKSTPPGAHI